MVRPESTRRLSVITAALFLILAPLAAARLKNGNDPRYAAFTKPLTKTERLNHALNRLTFGPRPGDLQELEHTGLNTWIKTQLHPENIAENPTLTDRLRPYDSLRMSIQEAYLQYPSRQLIRAVARGNAQPPDDPELRATVDRLAHRYLQKKQDLAGATSADPEFDLEPKVKLRELLNSAQINILERGAPAQKKDLLASIPTAQQLDFAWALRPRQAQQLLTLAPVAFRRKLMLAQNPQSVVTTDLSEGKLLRAIYSTHQLQELLVDFWFNHFNVFQGKGPEPYLLASYERDTIRPHVFGKFYDLLLATAQSPAMLVYLDNWQSVAPGTQDRRPSNAQKRKRGLNENYGRELLELHTLGVDGGYTQNDVIEVARCFTGWTIQRPEKGAEFRFNDKVHDHGQKTVLGHIIPPGGGISDGLTVLKILVHQPATAHFISLKLAQKFVADDPPPSLVDKMTKTFSRSDGDLRQVMQTMLASREFWSQGAYQAKVKTPLEMIVSAIRATNANVDSAYALANEIRRLGEPLYQKVEPTGYSTANAEWVSSASLLDRMNFALTLAHNHLSGTTIDTALWQTQTRNDADVIARSLLQHQPNDQTLAAIRTMLATPDLQKQAAANAQAGPLQTFGLIAGLVLGSPEFQRR